MTLQERYVAALTACGCKPCTTRSRKYLCFTGPKPGLYYYLGKSGSLRVGRCRTASIPVTERVKRLLLDAAPDTSVRAMAEALGI
jgi:hypothetical protein